MLSSFRFATAGRALIAASALVFFPLAGNAQMLAVAPPPTPTVVALRPLSAAPLALHLPGSPHDARREEAQRLFNRRRIGGVLWSLIGGTIFIRTVTSDVRSDQIMAAAFGGLVLGGIPAGIGIGKLSRFSRYRENQALGAYDNGGTFPHYVEKRLD